MLVLPIVLMIITVLTYATNHRKKKGNVSYEVYVLPFATGILLCSLINENIPARDINFIVLTALLWCSLLVTVLADDEMGMLFWVIVVILFLNGDIERSIKGIETTEIELAKEGVK